MLESKVAARETPADHERPPGVATATLLAIAIVMWPFLSYLGNNIALGLAPGDVLPLGGAVAAAVLLLGGLVRMVARRANFSRVLGTLAVAVALFFCYDILREAMSTYALGHIRYVGPLWAAVFLVGTALAWLMLARRNGFLILAAVIVGTLVVPLGRIGWFYADAAPAAPLAGPAQVGQAPAPVSGAPATARPDVFFFIFDGYARDDQLRKNLGFDNGGFIADLEARGFYVARKSRANYLQTVLSLSSTLSMDYHYTEGDFALGGLQQVLHGANPTVRRFRELGYTYVYAVPNFWHGSHCTGIEDVCIGPTINLREYHRELLNLTPLGHLAMFLVPDFVKELFDTTGDVTLATVRERLADVPARPLFVFGHMMFPHPPYRFNPDCSYRTTDPKGHDAYLDNLSCTNRQIIEAVDWIDRRHRGAIVILQSDHGYKFGRDPEIDAEDLPVGLDWEAFDGLAGILNAWRLPAPCRRHLDPSITAVNTFRLTLACIEGRAPEFVDDRFFLSSYKTFRVRPYTGPGGGAQ